MKKHRFLKGCLILLAGSLLTFICLWTASLMLWVAIDIGDRTTHALALMWGMMFISLSMMGFRMMSRVLCLICFDGSKCFSRIVNGILRWFLDPIALFVQVLMASGVAGAAYLGISVGFAAAIGVMNVLLIAVGAYGVRQIKTVFE